MPDKSGDLEIAALNQRYEEIESLLSAAGNEFWNYYTTLSVLELCAFKGKNRLVALMLDKMSKEKRNQRFGIVPGLIKLVKKLISSDKENLNFRLEAIEAILSHEHYGEIFVKKISKYVFKMPEVLTIKSH